MLWITNTISVSALKRQSGRNGCCQTQGKHTGHTWVGMLEDVVVCDHST